MECMSAAMAPKERNGVTGTWCERCEMEWCDCPRDGSVRKVSKTSADSARSFPVWPEMPDAPERAVIIKKDGKAHLYGACDHLEISVIAAPNFGWVPDVPARTWQRIAFGNPLQATEGNTACTSQSCDTSC